jgi:hypothetical protein
MRVHHPQPTSMIEPQRSVLICIDFGWHGLECASTHHNQHGVPNSYVAVVCVTLASTPVPAKKICSNIWRGLSPGIYGT